MDEEINWIICKITVEKINCGMAFFRKYHVKYTNGKEIVHDIPTDRMKKFIKDNRTDMTKVAFIFTDRSSEV